MSQAGARRHRSKKVPFVEPSGSGPEWDEKSHGKFHGNYALSFAAHMGVPYVKADKPKVVRPRESGIVGPEPDYSIVNVRNLNISQTVEHCKRFGYTEKEVLSIVGTRFDANVPTWSRKTGFGPSVAHTKHGVISMQEFARTRPEKGCFRTADMTSADVVQWTKLAHKCGIRFAKNGYSFPSKRKAISDIEVGSGKDAFVIAKAMGLVPQHIRSRKGALARKLKKGFRKSIRKGRCVGLEVRNLVSPKVAKTMRRNGQQVPKGLVVAVKSNHSPCPDIVQDAIRKMNSVPPVLVPKYRRNPVAKQEGKRTFVPQGFKPEPKEFKAPYLVAKRDPISSEIPMSTIPHIADVTGWTLKGPLRRSQAFVRRR